MNINPDKVKKSSRVLRIVVNVLFWSTIIVGVALTIVFLVIAFAPGEILKLPKSGNISISLLYNEMISYKVDPGMLEKSGLRSVILTYIPAILVGASMLAIVFRQVANILRTVENDCPFDENNSKRLTTIGMVLIAGSSVFNAAQYVIIKTIITNFKITNIEAKYTFDSNMMIAGFLVLILAGVFRYGNFLQKEYDATL